MKIKGIVTTGLGKGKIFVSWPVYSNIFEKYLKSKPYPGTLNLTIDRNYCKYIKEYFENGDRYDNLTHNGKKTGGIIVIKLKLKKENHELNVIAIRPLLTTHQESIIEVVSEKNLREYWKLYDGDHLDLDFI